MVAWIKDKHTIENLDKKELVRLVCILMSPKDTTSSLKVDWNAAAQRYGVGSSEGMRVNSGKLLKKVQTEAERNNESAQASTGETPAKTTSPSKGEGTKGRRGSKRAATDGTTEDLIKMGVPSPKRTKKGAVKIEASNEEDGY